MARDFLKCPRCGSLLIETPSFAGPPSEFWKECSNCNTFVNTYIPQEHQESLHNDDHRYIGNFGGYGTGKTLTSREEVLKHILITPKANVLIGANVASQYEQTIKRELEADIPAAFVKYYSAQKQYMDLINGARIMYRPFDDPEKLRSLNLTMFVIVEASETKDSVLVQLKTRLRNIRACTFKRDEKGKILKEKLDNGSEIPIVDKDWRKGIIESNPDSGWIRTEVLYTSDKIYRHGKVLDDFFVQDARKDPAVSAHVSSSDVNRYLPPTAIEEWCKNKPTWWISRYVLGSFSYSEGLVYPSATKHIVPSFEIPTDWKRLMAFDYGLVDPSVFLFGAVDEKGGVVYIYKEVRNTNKNVEQLSHLFFTASGDIPVGGWFTAPIIDPKSGSQRDYNKKTLADHFLDYGIAFKPGFVNVDARVFRVNTYLECERLKIFDTCYDLIEELRDYKFKPKTLNSTNSNDKPVDKNNHGINALEWIVMELPADPKNILYGAYNSKGEKLTLEMEQIEKNRWLPHALQDDPEDLAEMYNNIYAEDIDKFGIKNW